MENQHVKTAQPASAPESLVPAIGFQPHRFWKADPKNWFEVVEIQFSEAKITSQTMQFVIVISSLDKEVIRDLDIAALWQDKAPYSALKKDLVARFAMSTEAKFATLLGLQLADRRPTEFLRQIRNLAESDATEALLRAIFTQQMPTIVRQILAASTAPLNELAMLADKILEVLVTSKTPTVRASEPQHQHEPRLQPQPRGNRRGRGSGRQRSKSRNRTSGHVCYYHVTYGAEAHKCNLDGCLLKHLITNKFIKNDLTIKEVKKENESKLCAICMSADRNVSFVPCGHVASCLKCALSIQECPICKSQFKSILRLYFS